MGPINTASTVFSIFYQLLIFFRLDGVVRQLMSSDREQFAQLMARAYANNSQMQYVFRKPPEQQVQLLYDMFRVWENDICIRLASYLILQSIRLSCLKRGILHFGDISTTTSDFLALAYGLLLINMSDDPI